MMELASVNGTLHNTSTCAAAHTRLGLSATRIRGFANRENVKYKQRKDPTTQLPERRAKKTKTTSS